MDALKSGGIRVSVCIEGITFDMQLDTAADVSLLPDSLNRKHLSHLPLFLKTNEKQTVDLAGKITVIVQYENQGVNVPLTIVRAQTKRICSVCSGLNISS